MSFGELSGQLESSKPAQSLLLLPVVCCSPLAEPESLHYCPAAETDPDMEHGSERDLTAKHRPDSTTQLIPTALAPLGFEHYLF